MSDISKSSITIEAPASQVTEVLFDLAKYPEWSSSIKSVEVLETDGQARPLKIKIKVDAGPLRDTAILVYDWSKAPDALSFELEDADLLTEMSGAYSISENSDGETEVTYELSVDLSMPVPAMMRKKAELATIEQVLSQLKEKIEA